MDKRMDIEKRQTLTIKKLQFDLAELKETNIRLKRENSELMQERNALQNEKSRTFYCLTALDALMSYHDGLTDEEKASIEPSPLTPREVGQLEHQVATLMNRFSIYDWSESISTHFDNIEDFAPLKEAFDKLIASNVYEGYY